MEISSREGIASADRAARARELLNDLTGRMNIARLGEAGANTRATASVPEPAAKGRMKLMGRVGRHSLCACARAGAARLAASRLRRCKFMFLSRLAVHPPCPFLRWRGW
jgi:hypothetical protein